MPPTIENWRPYTRDKKGEPPVTKIKPLELSRTAIEEYIKCPRCFYLHRVLKLAPPRTIPLTLAVATDALLKLEFDKVRETDASHPLWDSYGLHMTAFKHPDLDRWRNIKKGGIRVVHNETGYEIYGAIDDVWKDKNTGKLVIVDYKSTSKKEEPSLEGGFGPSYKRQIEIYQWIFKTAGFDVDTTGYFLYVNGRKTDNFYQDGGGLIGRMLFNTVLIPHEGNTDWVSNVIGEAVQCATSKRVPEESVGCDNCKYFSERSSLF